MRSPSETPTSVLFTQIQKGFEVHGTQKQSTYSTQDITSTTVSKSEHKPRLLTGASTQAFEPKWFEPGTSIFWRIELKSSTSCTATRMSACQTHTCSKRSLLLNLLLHASPSGPSLCSLLVLHPKRTGRRHARDGVARFAWSNNQQMCLLQSFDGRRLPVPNCISQLVFLTRQLQPQLTSRCGCVRRACDHKSMCCSRSKMRRSPPTHSNIPRPPLRFMPPARPATAHSSSLDSSSPSLPTFFRPRHRPLHLSHPPSATAPVRVRRSRGGVGVEGEDSRVTNKRAVCESTVAQTHMSRPKSVQSHDETCARMTHTRMFSLRS